MVTSASPAGSALDAQSDAEEPTEAQRAKLISLPGELARRLRAWAATSPGKLGVMLTGLVIGSLVVGVVGGLTIMGKQSSLDDLIEHRGPMNEASQQVYRALTDSEASAAAGFLAKDEQANKLREQYERDLRDAGGGLAIAAGDAQGSSGGDQQVRKLATLLPKYAGQLATAYAHNGQDGPGGPGAPGGQRNSSGSDDLIKASDVLHESMILPAQYLWAGQVDALNSSEEDAAAIPWVAVVLTVLLLIGLYLVQRYLRKRTKRSFNIGLVVATIAVLAAVLWSAAALTVSGLNLAKGSEHGSEQMSELSRVRLLAVQARGSENLALVAKDGQRYEQDFKDLMGKLRQGSGEDSNLFGKLIEHTKGTPTAEDVRTARQALDGWMSKHESLRQKDSSGQHQQAVQQAVGDEQDGAVAQFNKVDNALGSAIDKARGQFASSARSASNALTMLGVGVIVLGVLAAIGAAGGMWQRIREYR